MYILMLILFMFYIARRNTSSLTIFRISVVNCQLYMLSEYIIEILYCTVSLPIDIHPKLIPDIYFLTFI